ncbi:MAG TPA: tetratricopeptide repeat protein [Chthoniobacteraceae bacterium]|jgi:TolA-binding protein|nr:tetratricopeptide repeat protein [Chthoniobacteraceae bacterium]
MKLLSSLSFFVRVVLVGVLAGLVLPVSPAFAQAPAPGRDQTDFDKAQQATDAGKLEEAASYYEAIPVNYPTSPLIPAATVRLGYVYFRLQQYDKAVKTLQTVSTLKNVPPEMAELSMSLIPQALSAKAVAEGPKSPQRTRLFEDAIKGFDAFIQKYPKSEEVESANYGKAVANYQIEQYKPAMEALRVNLTVFKLSEGVLDSQYLMALTMATVANKQAQEGKPEDQKAVDDGFKNAELMLADIVNKGTDVALANDSRFQIGELLFSRAGFSKDKEAQKALFQRAMDVYRIVAGKDVMIAAQKARIERFRQAKIGAVRQNDLPLVKRFNRAIEREQEKLSNIETRPDQTLVARVKIGQVFYQIDRLDECRVMLSYVKPLIEDEDQKKSIAYYIALSLARQNADLKGSIPALVERTEKVYSEFTAAYPADPIAENLPLIVGAGFIDSDPPKAEKYFEELKKNYPNTKLGPTAGALSVTVLIKQKKYDEALAVATEALAGNPTKEVAAAMKFAKATVLQLQGNLAEALPIFKDVRDNYPGTEQAIQASFFYPRFLVEAGDFRTALPELQSFVNKNPKNLLLPTALFYLAQAQVGTSRPAEALATYKRLADEFPQAEVAPFSYFERTKILGPDKPDEIIALMHEFMEKYPDAASLFQAYDFVAQIEISKQYKTADGKPDPDKKETGRLAAIEMYEKFAGNKPNDPMTAQALLRVGTLWKELAEGMGRWNLVRQEDRPEWQKRLASSMNAAERVVRQFPDAQQVALALVLLLDDQKLLITAKLKTDADVEAYFEKLADEFKDKPPTRSKIVFTLAGNLIEKDKAKALGLMEKAYDPSLKYAPADMDLYGTGLIDQKKLAEAEKVYKKLGDDYPVPSGKLANEAPRDIQEAQSMMLFGLGKILQDQGKPLEAQPLFDELERNYAWSPKMVAASLGIAEALYNQKKYDEALKRLAAVVRNGKAPAELRAKGMFLLAKIHEEMGNFDDAINNYVKISAMYQSVPKVAAEGLYRGALLLEKQSKGEIAIPTPVPRATPAKKPVPGAKGTPAPTEVPTETASESSTAAAK